MSAESSKASPAPSSSPPEPETSEDTHCDADAFFCMGHCCENGLHGFEKDVARAATMYRLAAEADHTDAQWRLGELYEFGRGVERNDEEAVRWYRQAAEAGNAQAQSGLALFLEEGRGISQDHAEAFKWHLAAAEKGHALSQYCAGCCLAEGRGTSHDHAAAQQWLSRSALAGFEPARQLLITEESGQEDSAEIVDGEGTNIETDSLMDLARRVASHLESLSTSDAAEAMKALSHELPSDFHSIEEQLGEDEDTDLPNQRGAS